MNNQLFVSPEGSSYTFVKNLTGDFSPTILGDFEIGDNLNLNGLVVTGFRLPTENDLAGVPGGIAGGVLITEANLKRMAFSFWSDKDKDFSHYQIPASAFICGRASDAKKGYYYEVEIEGFNLGSSMFHVFQALPALPAGQFYVLQLIITYRKK